MSHTCTVKEVYNFTFSLLIFLFFPPGAVLVISFLLKPEYSCLNLSGNLFQTHFYGLFQLFFFERESDW